MVFSSLFFLYVFLPLNIVLYFFARTNRTRNVIMVAFSLVFYAWGEPVWVVLLILTALLNWALALVMDSLRGSSGQKAALTAAVAVDLCLLGLFKYSGFLYENINGLLGTSFQAPGFTLPIGISFYTFQIISYMVDVYRGDVKAQRSYLKFLMYVTMYHQLVAGPIVRYRWIAEEIDNRTVDTQDIWGGFCRFCVGLTKKVAVANVAGQLASRFLDGDLSRLSSMGALLGMLLFSLQIYYDFSAYSDMAIGMGRIFGFHYNENFRYPYTATSVTDFWRRWHISLSSFFRDYVYIPLGGKYSHQMRNICIVWLLTGLWHGASWNFVLWGAYYGLLLIFEKQFLLARLSRLPRPVGILWSWVAVFFGWSLFYYTDLSRLGGFLMALLGGGAGFTDPAVGVVVLNNILWLCLAIRFCAPILPAIRARAEAVPPQRQYRIVIAQAGLCGLMLIISTALLVGQSYNPFLYFRF